MKNRTMIFLAVIAIFAVAFSGCSKMHSSPTDPGTGTSTPTVTPTPNAAARATQTAAAIATSTANANATATAIASAIPTATPNAVSGDMIAGMMSYQNIMGIAIGIGYQIAVYSPAGVTITTANVTLTGPGLNITLPYSAANYNYNYLSTNTPSDFQFNSQYTVTVVDGLKTYSQTYTTMSDIVIPADGSTATWSYGTGNTLTAAAIVIDPSYGSHNYGPGLASPYNFAAAGVYGYGAGSYNITFNVVDLITTAFPGSNPQSALIITNQRMTMVLK